MPTSAQALPSSNSDAPDAPVIWLVDEGTPGHTVQTEGLGRVLETRLNAKLSWVKCRLQLRGFWRPLARAATASAPAPLARLLILKLYQGIALPEGRPDLVISSCGNSAYLTRLLARVTGARTIFVGEVAPFPGTWFDLVVAPVDQSLPNGLVSPLMETGQSPARAAAAAAKLWPQGAPAGCWSVLIGGASRSHPFIEADWIALAQGLNAIHRRQAIRWLLTTSRRTGTDAERVLRAHLEPAALADAAWWATEPRKVVAAFLHAGERVFVTQDSMTMISEAVAVRGHAEVIQPALTRLPATSFVTRYLSHLHEAGRIHQHTVASLVDYAPAPLAPQPLDAAQSLFADTFAAQVAKLSRPRPTSTP